MPAAAFALISFLFASDPLFERVSAIDCVLKGGQEGDLEVRLEGEFEVEFEGGLEVTAEVAVGVGRAGVVAGGVAGDVPVPEDILTFRGKYILNFRIPRRYDDVFCS